MTKIPVLLLAAGSSSRMGRPKQLLPWGNATLIEHQIKTLANTGHPLCVVLGSNSELIIPVIEKYNIIIIINDRWEEGMGSSVSCGISHIIKSYPDADGVLIALSDQPLVTTEYITQIIRNFQSGAMQILVSKSGTGWKGVPALFDKFYFKELSELRGETGAKKIMNNYKENVIVFDGGEMNKSSAVIAVDRQ